MSKIDLSLHSIPTPSPNRCFLCGKHYAPEEITREHVFPKWLQRKLNLFDNQLHFLNGTVIPYRKLMVPACIACNRITLSSIEKKVAIALNDGASAIRALGHELLYIWMAKIFFGIIYAEGLLPIDRSQPDSKSILSHQVINSFEFLHLLMQAARTQIDFHGSDTSFHSSILVFKIQQHPNPTYRFMYRDDIEYGCIAIKLDTVGLICITDGGAQELLAQEIMPALFEHNLHPLQFEEICAKVFTKARTMKKVPKYISTSSPDRAQVIQMPLTGFSNSPIFGEWDQEFYTKLLTNFTGIPIEIISPENGVFMTWIEDLSHPKFIDVIDLPWP